AAVILTYSKEALHGLRPAERERARAVVHIGVEPTEASPCPPARTPDAELRVLTGGRLVHWKGYDLIIEGFARFLAARPESEAPLVVTGSGPFQPRLEALVRQHCLQEHVRFLGRLETVDEV